MAGGSGGLRARTRRVGVSEGWTLPTIVIARGDRGGQTAFAAGIRWRPSGDRRRPVTGYERRDHPARLAFSGLTCGFAMASCHAAHPSPRRRISRVCACAGTLARFRPGSSRTGSRPSGSSAFAIAHRATTRWSRFSGPRLRRAGRSTHFRARLRMPGRPQSRERDREAAWYRPGSARRRRGPGFGDEKGRAAWLRAAPYCARAACTRARSLAASPFGCKHESESGRLGSVGETAALPLKELSARRLLIKRDARASKRRTSRAPPKPVVKSGTGWVGSAGCAE